MSLLNNQTVVAKLSGCWYDNPGGSPILQMIRSLIGRFAARRAIPRSDDLLKNARITLKEAMVFRLDERWVVLIDPIDGQRTMRRLAIADQVNKSSVSCSHESMN